MGPARDGRLPMAMLLAAAILWGLSIPVMKALGAEQVLLAPGLGSIPLSLGSLCARFGLAALVVAIAVRTGPWRITPYEWRHGFGLGAVTAASMLLQVDGLHYTSAATAGFLIALYCVLVPVIACALGRRRWSLPLAGSCLLVLVGLAVLTGLSPASMALGRGEWENLGAALLFSVQILWIASLRAGAFDPSRLTMSLGLSVAFICLALLALAPGGVEGLFRIHASPRAFWLTAGLGVLGTALPFLAMNRYQPLVDPVPAGFIYCFEPLAAVIGAVFLPELLTREPSLYPNEALSWRTWTGGAFIIGANLLLLIDPQGKTPPTA